MEIPDLPIEEKKEAVKPSPKIRKSPLDMFFSLGPKDPKRKADYDYYLFWIVFLTLSALAMNYYYQVFTTGNYMLIGWGVLLSIFAYFQFSNLKMMREQRKFLRETGQMHQEMQPIKVESKEEMMKEFK